MLFRQYPVFISVAKEHESNSRIQEHCSRPFELSQPLKTLPTVNLNTLALLCRFIEHLANAVADAPVELTGSRAAISGAFLYSIIRPKVPTVSTVLDCSFTYDVVYALAQNSSSLFAKCPHPKKALPLSSTALALLHESKGSLKNSSISQLYLSPRVDRSSEDPKLISPRRSRTCMQLQNRASNFPQSTPRPTESMDDISVHRLECKDIKATPLHHPSVTKLSADIHQPIKSSSAPSVYNPKASSSHTQDREVKKGSKSMLRLMKGKQKSNSRASSLIEISTPVWKHGLN